jgi:hypothetical protein
MKWVQGLVGENLRDNAEVDRLVGDLIREICRDDEDENETKLEGTDRKKRSLALIQLTISGEPNKDPDDSKEFVEEELPR